MLHNLVFAVAVLICSILPEKMILSLFFWTSQKRFDQFNQKELIVTVSKVSVELSKVSFD